MYANSSLSGYYLDILNIFRPSSTFKEIEKYETNIKNENNEKIRFHVFVEVGEYDDKYFNIIFHKDTNIQATCNYIIKNNKNDLLKLNNHIVYYFRGTRTTQRDNDILKNVLKPKKSYQIEELIKQISKKHISDVYDTQEFVLPAAFVFPQITPINKNENTTKTYKNFTSLKNEYLLDWYNNSDNSILVLKGQGGIGKTTMSKYFGNFLLENNPYISKIFIDSLDAKNFLLNNFEHQTPGRGVDLYDLYRASSNGQNILDNTLFKNNLDAGNFFIIIDGIDELISKVQNFDIDHFLKSIDNFYSVIKNIKVIITCRTYFWNFESTDDYKIDCVEIHPFTKKQAHSFFDQSFKHNERKIVKAMEYAVTFHKPRDKITNQKAYNNKTQPTESEHFHPYALDLLSRIINSERAILDDNKKLCSKLLNADENLDYLIDRICFRENFLQGKVRILDLTVDEQIQVFKQIAVKYNGFIASQSLQKCISDAISLSNQKNIPLSLVEAFKTHLLVELDEQGVISFKYDFLLDFFKSVYISNYFDAEHGEEKVSGELLELFRGATFDSAITSEVPKRIREWGDLGYLKLSDILSQIRDAEILNKKLVYSGFFNLAFSINSRLKANSTVENTILLEQVFETDENQIENLCLINVFDNNQKIKFDFSGKFLKNCEFDNYIDFWNCTFSNEIFFSNCKLKKLGTRLSKSKIEFDLNKHVDKNCRYDESFSSTFNRNELISEELKERINAFSNSVFRFFYTRGTLWSRNYEESEGAKYIPFVGSFSGFGDINVNCNEFVQITEKMKILTTFFHTKHQTKKIEINSIYRSDIIKFLEEGAPSEIVDKFKRELYNYVRK